MHVEQTAAVERAYPQLLQKLFEVDRAAAIGVEVFEERQDLVGREVEARLAHRLRELGDVERLAVVVVDDAELALDADDASGPASDEIRAETVHQVGDASVVDRRGGGGVAARHDVGERPATGGLCWGSGQRLGGDDRLQIGDLLRRLRDDGRGYRL